MKAILQEYGMILVSIAITLIFILFASPFGNTVVDYVEDSLAKFYSESMKYESFEEIENAGPQEERPEGMNEYGFYFEKKYQSIPSVPTDATWQLTFYNDGTAKGSASFPIGSPSLPDGGIREINVTDLTYEKNKIITSSGSDTTYIIKDEGKTIHYLGVDLFLTE